MSDLSTSVEVAGCKRLNTLPTSASSSKQAGETVLPAKNIENVKEYNGAHSGMCFKKKKKAHVTCRYERLLLKL